MNNNRLHFDDDDYFSPTRMSFGDHIEELRRHLIRAIVGFAIGVAIAFPLAFPITDFIKAPMEEELREFYDRQEKRLREKYEKTPDFQKAAEPQVKELPVAVEFARRAGWKVEALSDQLTEDGGFLKVPTLMNPLQVWEDLGPVRKFLERRAELITLRVEEAFLVYVKVALIAGLVISCPWVFYQIWAFIAAGLYPHEKRLINVYLPISVVLFAGGVIFCEIVIIPRAVNALLMFNDWLGVAIEPRLSDWLDFAIIVPVLSGLSFQTPLVMMFLERLGIGNIQNYQAFRKYAYFGMAIAAAVFSPTPDAYTMLLLWVPMCLFYELGIILCRIFPSKPLFDLDIPDPDEMVEV